MGWKDKRTGMFPGKELRIKGNKEQRSHESLGPVSLKTPSGPELPVKRNEKN